MEPAFNDLTAVRDALLDLPSSGPSGFEGLLATVFAKLLGVPFRLAKSGSQFGVDGKSADPEFPVTFEAKRYKDDVPSTEILNKIGALAIRDDSTELWVLGTTGTVTTQPADDLEALASRLGFSTLILDWQTDTPRLPAVLSSAPAEVGEFLTLHVPTSGLAAKAVLALKRLSDNANLATVARAALDKIRGASVATPLALDANGRWLRETLSNRRLAKGRLGQVISPLEPEGAPVLSRSRLLGELRSAIQAPPVDRLIAVLGDEGNGKSWLAMKFWAESPSPPLMVVFSPEELGAVPQGSNWDLVLAQKLIAQTEESYSDVTTKRWLRRLDRWRRSAPPALARLLVLVDGLNQRPSIAWGRQIDSLVLHVFGLGGCTVVTSRTEYFRRHVEPRLISNVTAIVVPLWTTSERDEILDKKGVAATSLHPAVAHSLLNPRLLGVALALLDADMLRSLDALSVPQLLFEHLRMLDREGADVRSAQEFADMLQSHARDILERVRSAASDDVTVFNQLEPAAEGQFFRLLQGEAHRYTLRDQGLTYALGLAVVDELRGALRNQRDVHETLKAVLEPVAALDQTADAILAALTVACLDSQVPEQIGVVLLGGFVQLQNLDEAQFRSFTELARRRVRVFCEASEMVWMDPTQAPNEDWLEEALQSVKHHPEVWIDIKPSIERWLRFWWPDEEVESKLRRTQGSLVEERSRLAAERDHRIDHLSEVEREYLSRLIHQEASPYRLMTLALQLCAGLPLAEFTDALACASFSMALTPSPYAPDDDFSNLVRFNCCDWLVIREQLRAHGQRLTAGDSSRSGRWAAVSLLYATGAAEDSMEAHKLASDLNKDRKRGIAWRRVEAYCATDPCDPDSARPDNIDGTAREYEQSDVNKLKLIMGTTQEDLYWEAALPGLSRFSSGVAVRKHREFLATIPIRRGLALRQAIWAALNDAVLMDHTLAGRFLALSLGLSNDPADVDASSVEHVQQALLLAAFPRLSPVEQLSGLAAVLDPNHIWLEVLRVAKQGSPSQLMDAVRQMGPSDIKVLVPLELACLVADQALPSFSEMLPDLLTSPYAVVRSAALTLSRLSRDLGALQAVVASGWTATSLPRTDREHIAGSIALLEAAKSGVVRGTEILPRIAPETFGVACGQLDREAAEQVALMLDACVRAASGFDVPLPPIEIVLTVTRRTDTIDARHSLSEPALRATEIADTLLRLSESEVDFDARQKRLHNAYDAFKASINPQTAALVLEAFKLDGLQTMLRVAPGLVDGWINLLRANSAPRRRALRNFGLLLASALTHETGRLKEAVELLSLLQNDSSYVQIRYTAARLPLESVALWWATDDLAVNNLRCARLDRCANDHDLALEAAAALYTGKAAILKAYVQDRLTSPNPADVARAITVIGFSDDEQLASDVIAAYGSAKGLLGTAAETCRFAMDRHRWTKHWFGIMQTAKNDEDFWTASNLFVKVVDARFDALHHAYLTGTDVFNTWWWSVERRVQRRFEKWSDKRKKTLFGAKAPNAIYLLPAAVHSDVPPEVDVAATSK